MKVFNNGNGMIVERDSRPIVCTKCGEEEERCPDFPFYGSERRAKPIQIRVLLSGDLKLIDSIPTFENIEATFAGKAFQITPGEKTLAIANLFTCVPLGWMDMLSTEWGRQ